jgi:hypothetical protein
MGFYKTLNIEYNKNTNLEELIMSENDFDYYLIGRDGNFTSPLLMNDDKKNSGATEFLDRMQEVDGKEPIYLVFNPPIPKKPAMTDYLYLQCRAVFSKKIYNVLKDTDIKDFQLVSSIITDNKGEEYSDYWIAGIYREFAFLDEAESEFFNTSSDGHWIGIEKMVINKELMSKVPLKDRLIYVGKESSAYVYWHKSIVDIIMSVEPTGVRFTSVDEWEN